MAKKLSEIRSAFLDYFADKDHQILPSAPLVPQDDPSLMFVNAGMVQFKNYFTGKEQPKFARVATAQKCVRAGGKHNDLENVGYTARHHTFFEMLGNFSFGDYFKEEAILYGYEFVTKILGLPQDKLIVTVFHDDDEAFNLWRKIAGFPEDKIRRINSSDNFWSMGDTGPCGPCSEIFYDHGEQLPGCIPGTGDEGDRFIEIWNLVFMQYEKKADGTRIALPKPAIDTGMGLERVAAILQGKHNNFEVDLFADLIAKAAQLTNIEQQKYLTSYRVIVDHLRSINFLLADGVLPSNEGRGYVLRRIMRRAMRHIHHLGYQGNLLSELSPYFISRMGNHYNELQSAQETILSNIAREEEQFGRTLDKGLKILAEALEKQQPGKIFPGDIVFKLYDTYGFPVDLTADILREKNLQIDEARFAELMQEQKNRGKENWQGSGSVADQELWFKLNEKIGDTEFVGYSSANRQSKVSALVKNGQEVAELNMGDQAQIILAETCFYAESGGQIGDQGLLKNDRAEFKVTDTKKHGNGLIVHYGELVSGELKLADQVQASFDLERRNQIKANHSATHLLHKALQNILGKHVSQQGSYVAADLLRFDFSHHEALTLEQIAQLEEQVNQVIRNNTEVVTELMSLAEAKKSGAQALFGEKYAEQVRVLTIGELEQQKYSQELCGGTHVERTGDIALFKIISESSIASGVRRIEALTGEAAFNYLSSKANIINELAQDFKVKDQQIIASVAALKNDRKQLEKQIAQLKQQQAAALSDADIYALKEQKIIFKIAENLDGKNARELVMQLKQKAEFAAVILLAQDGAKISVIVASKAPENFNAVEIVQKLVAELGGKGGGGKPDFAQGGAAAPSNLPDKDTLLKFLYSEIARA